MKKLSSNKGPTSSKVYQNNHVINSGIWFQIAVNTSQISKNGADIMSSVNFVNIVDDNDVEKVILNTISAIISVINTTINKLNAIKNFGMKPS